MKLSAINDISIKQNQRTKNDVDGKYANIKVWCKENQDEVKGLR